MPSELLGSLPLAMKSKRRQFRRLDYFLERVLFQQIIGQSDAVADTQHLVQGRPAQVGVHYHHPAAVLCENRGQIEDRRGFAFARSGTDDGDRVQFFILAREQQVGPQNAVSFRMRALCAFFDQEPDVLRNDAQHRQSAKSAPRRRSS